jgi:hypothetical protein
MSAFATYRKLAGAFSRADQPPKYREIRMSSSLRIFFV